MSTLNKAFIKAYQRRGVGAPHMPLRTASTPPADKISATTLLEDPAENVVDDSLPTTEPPTSPARAGSPASPDSSVSPGSPASPLAETQPALSDPVGEHLEDYLATSGDLFPAFEVERFEWPQAVSTLLKNSPQLGSLLSELLPDGRGTLLVSGCRRGEGRTSVALLLARHLGRSGARVAILDADLQQPQLASRLGMLVEAGWETSLDGELPPGEALIESLRDRLTLVPLKRPVSDEEFAGTSRCLPELVKRLQTEFEIVCVDSGPLAEGDPASQETLLGQAPIDAAVVVRDVRRCRLEQTHAVGRKLAQLGVRRWAVVENFCGAGATSA